MRLAQTCHAPSHTRVQNPALPRKGSRAHARGQTDTGKIKSTTPGPLRLERPLSPKPASGPRATDLAFQETARRVELKSLTIDTGNSIFSRKKTKLLCCAFDTAHTASLSLSRSGSGRFAESDSLSRERKLHLDFKGPLSCTRSNWRTQLARGPMGRHPCVAIVRSLSLACACKRRDRLFLES